VDEPTHDKQYADGVGAPLYSFHLSQVIHYDL
jgi:hypothetical protein